MRIQALVVPDELPVCHCLHLLAVLDVLGRQHQHLQLLRSSPLPRHHLLVEVEVALPLLQLGAAVLPPAGHHVPQRGRCLRLLHLRTWLEAAHQVWSYNTL